MSAGISRVHGYVVAPSQRPSTLSFFNLQVSGNLTTSDATTANGALDQIFRTALDSFATVGLIGTPTYNGTTATYVNFAIEDTGVLSGVAGQTAPSGLGLGSVEGTTASTVTAALTAAVQALGTVNGFNLSTATVFAGVVATTSPTL